MNCNGFNMVEASTKFCSHFISISLKKYHCFMQLCQAIFCIPISTKSCEWGFNQQDIMKTIMKCSLKFENLGLFNAYVFLLVFQILLDERW